MNTTALQFGLLIGTLTGLGQAVAGSPAISALLYGAAIGCATLTALLIGDWMIGRISQAIDLRGASARKPVSPTEPRERDESPSERAIAA